MKAWRSAAILGAIAGGFLVATSIILQVQAGQLPPNELQSLPPIYDAVTCEASGDSKPWLDLRLINYPYKTEKTNTSAGTWSYTYKLVPEADLPFTVAPGSMVIIYNAVSGYPGYYFGYIAPNGWWLMFFGQPTRDPVIIADLLSKANP